MDENKKKALDAAVMQIEKDFGRGAVMRLGDTSAFGEVEVVPTGALSLDIALGLGGVPRGRVVEIYGPESSGKTTVSLHMADVYKRQLLYLSVPYRAFLRKNLPVRIHSNIY